MMAVVGLALAVTAIALGSVPFLGVMALVPASIGFVFSVIALVHARRTHYGKWLAIPGVVLSVAAACWVPVASTIVPAIVASVTDVSLDAAQAPPDGATASAPAQPARQFLPPPPRSAYSPPAMRRQPAATANPSVANVTASPDQTMRRELETSVEAIARSAKTGVDESWPEDVVALRAKIDGLPDEPTQAHLHRALDDGVMAVVEADAKSALESAQAAYHAGSIAEAVSALSAAAQRRATGGATVSYATPATPSVVAATEFQRQLGMLQDPSKRYAPRGVLGGSHGVRVTLHDALTGENRVVEEGSTLEDGSVVMSINEEAQVMELSREGASYALRW